MDKQNQPAMPQNIILEGRKKLSVSGVEDIDSFDDQTIVAYTDLGEMLVKGSGLHINKIDLESGDLSVAGNISSISYSDQPAPTKGLLSRLFR